MSQSLPPPLDDDRVLCAQGLVPERKVFEVHIEQGHKYGAKVVLRGEAGMSELGVLPGDVIFVLEPKPHKTFKRVGNDLILDKVPAHCLTWRWCLIRLPWHARQYPRSGPAPSAGLSTAFRQPT